MNQLSSLLEKNMPSSLKRHLYFWTISAFVLNLIALIVPFHISSILYIADVVLVFFLFLIYVLFLKFPFKLNALIGFSLLIQIWLLVTTLYAYLVLLRSTEFDVYQYRFLLYIFYFYVGYAFCALFPQSRRIIIFLLLLEGTFSVITAFFQFLHFSPAIHWANTVIGPGFNIAHWAGRDVLRAGGLEGWPGRYTDMCARNIFLLIGLTWGKVLKLSRFLLILFFLIGGLIAQFRTGYVLIGLALIFLIKLIWSQKISPKILYSSFLLISFGVFLGAEAKHLNYVLHTNLQTSESLKFRETVTWAPAYYVAQEVPWTGIGMDTRLEGFNPAHLNSKWTDANVSMDNGYLLFFSWGGYPAVAIIIVSFVTLIVLLWRLWKNHDLPSEHRAFVLWGLLTMVGFAITMVTRNGIIQTKTMTLIFFTAGFVMQTPFKKLDIRS